VPVGWPVYRVRAALWELRSDGPSGSAPQATIVSRSVTEAQYPHARVAAVVISSPDLCVFAVAAAGVLCAFACVVDALPEQCLRRRAGTNPLDMSLRFLKLIDCCMNVVRLHVNAADVLVRCSVDGFR
jgi:hypothetical protein